MDWAISNKISTGYLRWSNWDGSSVLIYSWTRAFVLLFLDDAWVRSWAIYSTVMTKYYKRKGLILQQAWNSKLLYLAVHDQFPVIVWSLSYLSFASWTRFLQLQTFWLQRQRCSRKHHWRIFPGCQLKLRGIKCKTCWKHWASITQRLISLK